MRSRSFFSLPDFMTGSGGWMKKPRGMLRDVVDGILRDLRRERYFDAEIE